MGRLIRSRFSRVFRSKTFYLTLVILFVIGFCFSLIYNKYYITDREYYSTRTLFSVEAEQMISYGPYIFSPASEDLYFRPSFCDMFNRIDVFCEEPIRYSYTLFGAITAVFIERIAAASSYQSIKYSLNPYHRIL